MAEMRDVVDEVPTLSGDGLRRAETFLAATRAIRARRRVGSNTETCAVFEQKFAEYKSP
jgi:hypothetical protein